jgi:hypothetical protein
VDYDPRADNSDIPNFITEALQINGTWFYLIDSLEVEFDQSLNDQIEKRYIKGDSDFDGVLQAQPFILCYTDSTLTIGAEP